MQVVRSYADVPAAARGGVLTIGNFDGVHRGHQAVIGEVKRMAQAHGVPAGAMLFDPHPRAFFQPDKPMFTLTPMPYRLDLLAALGLDFAAVLPFDKAMAELSARDFIANVLVGGFDVRHLVVGYDFNFGKGRTGNDALLLSEGKRYGYGLDVQQPAGDAGAVYSSSRVREALRAGDVAGAARQLGRYWRIEGTVIAGAGRGAGLGYPTANIELPPGVQLAHGIYAARVWIAGSAHSAAAYLGKRPTFDNGEPALEAFLIDYDENIYGQRISVDLVAFIRGDRSFSGAAALKAQMDRDVAEAVSHLRLDAVRP